MNNSQSHENDLYFKYSYGYDCRKWYNLCVCDENIIAWATGSMITFYDIEKHQRTFTRSTTGGSIGYIIKNPSKSFNHIAIAEGGFLDFSPLIIIYEWPSMIIVNKLEGGTNYNYSVLDYSINGNLLASIGGSPDYNLTIWDWKKNSVKLCSNAYTLDVNNVKFSTYIHDQLVTCGINHIKFWKMSETFTGLKLNGEIGRFGKTDISDILGILSMPDGKVLSGCSWGNILVWDAGKIKLEVSRKGRKSCHKAPITQLKHNPNMDEVISIGMDGHICTWSWNIVEQSILKDNEYYVELNPITEKYISNVQLVYLVHRRDNEWLAQDASGGIWIIDLDVDDETTDAEELKRSHAKKLIHSHGGAVVGIAQLVNDPYLITLGSDGSLLLHPINKGQPLPLTIYPEAASCFLYLSPYLKTANNVFVLGFENGTIRIIHLIIKSSKNLYEKSNVILLKILKPHNMSITTINFNNNTNIMLTSSLDKTIFIYRVEFVDQLPIFTPLYFIETPNGVSSVCWNPKNDNIVLLAGQGNFILEGTLPVLQNLPDPNKIVSYRNEFTSINLTILKNYKTYILSEEDLNIPINLTKSSLLSDDDKIKALLVTDNDESMDKEIIWAKYDINDNSQVWITQENCNCLMRLNPGVTTPNAYVLLCGDIETSITSQIISSNNQQILGMSNGEILIVEIPSITPDNYFMLSDIELKAKTKLIKDQTKNSSLKIASVPKIILTCLFRIPMHNSITGRITHILFSNDEKLIFTVAGDSNIFSYKVHPDRPSSSSSITCETDSFNTDIIVNIENKIKDCLTHEESIQDKERKYAEQMATNKKNKIVEKLASLKIEFEKLLDMNENLPPNQRIEIKEDQRVQEYILSNLNKQMALMHCRLAYQLEVSDLRLRKMMKRNIEPLDIFPFQVNSILYSDNVKIIRQKKLPDSFFTDLEEIKKKIMESQCPLEQFQSPPHSLESIENDDQSLKKSFEPEFQSHLLDDLPASPDPPRPLAKAIQDYLLRLEKQHSQEKEWQDHLSKYVDYKLDDATDDDEKPSDDFSLKKQSDGDIIGSSKIQSQLSIFNARKEIFDIQHDFNESVIQLRDQKFNLVKNIKILNLKLHKISKILPEKYVKPCPVPIPTIDESIEFAEKNLEVKLSVKNIDVHDIEISDTDAEFSDREGDEEFATRRIMLMRMKQDSIINEIKNSINEWEKSFKFICRKRERILLQSQFLKIHLLHLLREQVIVEPYESREDGILQNIQNVEIKVKECQDEISVCKKNIDSKMIPILGLKEQLKHIEQHFKVLIENNQYAAFLKRVYKKKQKLHKEHSGSIVSSSSSSKSTDDDSSDIEEMPTKGGTTRLRLDSTVCPPGCDPEVYEKVLQSRNIKHELELKMKEENDQINLIKKDIEIKNTHLKQLLEELQNKQLSFNDLMREKQLKLKDIETIVVLSADQCMADAIEEMKKGGGALVFPGAGIHNLQERVKTLLKDADEQKKRLSINKRHLKRMNADCNFMNNHINDLKGKIQHILNQKLRIPDVSCKNDKLDKAKKKVSEILDAVLQNMTNQFKLTTSLGLSSEMENQLIYWKKKQYSMEQQYCTALQEHTSKLQTRASLEAELFSYATIERDDSTINDQEYMTDLVRLRRIRLEQQKQIDDLKAEVQRLKLKPHISTILPPITPTNLSISPSIAVSSPSFELAHNSSGSRWIATSLAKELNLVETELMGSSNSSSTLMSTIAELFPILIEGKLDVNEAAEKILETYHTKKGGEEKDLYSYSASKAYNKSKQSIADILSQITKQNLKLGDAENTTAFDFGEIKNEPGAEVEYIIQELLQAGVSPDNSGAIDIAVAALIDVAPHLIDQKINVNQIICSLKDKTNIDVEIIRDMTIAVSVCLSAQEIIPAENSRVAAECLERLQQSLMDINSKSGVESQESILKKIIAKSVNNDNVAHKEPILKPSTSKGNK